MSGLERRRSGFGAMEVMVGYDVATKAYFLSMLFRVKEGKYFMIFLSYIYLIVHLSYI